MSATWRRGSQRVVHLDRQCLGFQAASVFDASVPPRNGAGERMSVIDTEMGVKVVAAVATAVARRMVNLSGGRSWSYKVEKHVRRL